MGSVNVIEFLEGSFGPDAESTDVSSRGELEEVESGDMDGLNSRNVPQSSDEGDVGTAVDDERSLSGSESSVSVFSVSGSDLDGAGDLLDITEGSDVLEELDGVLGSLDGFSGVVNDKWEFGNLVNSVSSGLDQGEDG